MSNAKTRQRRKRLKMTGSAMYISDADQRVITALAGRADDPRDLVSMATIIVRGYCRSQGLDYDKLAKRA